MTEFDPIIEYLPDRAPLVWEYPSECPDDDDQELFRLLCETYSYVSPADTGEEPGYRWSHLTNRLESCTACYVTRKTK